MTSRIEYGNSLTDVLRLLPEHRGIALMYDDGVHETTMEWTSHLPEGDLKCVLTTSGGEVLKDLSVIEELTMLLLHDGVDRDDLMVIIGGGATCDSGAFTASVYKRGIDFILIPTTLVAQADAAIGGKTAVDCGDVKNVMGTFAWPVFTFLCPPLLKTLPDKEFVSGAAELLKTFLLSGSHYEEAVEVLSQTGEGSRAEVALEAGLAPLILEAAKYKASVVEKDPLDKGYRQRLNLGHTFGHAIESAAGISHGEAVAIGMVLAARLSERLGLAERGFADKLCRDFKAVGLPTECPIPLKELEGLMVKDKKSQGGKIGFILPCGPGDVKQVLLEAGQAIEIMS